MISRKLNCGCSITGIILTVPLKEDMQVFQSGTGILCLIILIGGTLIMQEPMHQSELTAQYLLTLTPTR